MPAGLQIYNDFGTILIADTNPNYTYKSKGSAATNASSQLVLTVTDGVQPVIAFRSTAPVMLKRSARSGTTFTFTIFSETPGVTVDYWIFDVKGTPSTGYGLQVFNAAGQLMFDSSSKIALVAGDGNYPGTATVNTVLPAGRTYAAVAVAAGNGREGRDTFVGGMYEWDFRVWAPWLSYSGTTFTYKTSVSAWAYSSTEPNAMPPAIKNLYFTGAHVLYLDVTGY